MNIRIPLVILAMFIQSMMTNIFILILNYGLSKNEDFVIYPHVIPMRSVLTCQASMVELLFTSTDELCVCVDIYLFCI